MRMYHRSDLDGALSYLDAVLSVIPSALIGIEENGTVSLWNRKAEELTGRGAESAMGQQLGDVLDGLDDEPMKQINAAILSDGRCQIDRAMLTAGSGVRRWISASMARLQGEHSGCILSIEDISERLALEAQILQAQKMESIGQLAAGIAHEINTPTQFVGDNLTFIKESLPHMRRSMAHSIATDADADTAELQYLDEELPRALDQSIEGISRISSIVLAMKNFSHPDIEMRPVDLNQAILSTLTVAKNEYKYVADVVTDLDASMPPIACVVGEINQTVLNLIVNASHAIADHAGAEGRRGTISVSSRFADGKAEIRIADTGPGIPEAILGKIFAPFFTTKPIGKGTGQGLFIAHSVIVKRHGGTIDVETQPGQGTTFIIRLPASPVEPAT